jgi:hypothetical protein
MANVQPKHPHELKDGYFASNHMHLIYKSGANNPADYLSRHPTNESKPAKTGEDDGTIH